MSLLLSLRGRLASCEAQSFRLTKLIRNNKNISLKVFFLSSVQMSGPLFSALVGSSTQLNDSFPSMSFLVWIHSLSFSLWACGWQGVDTWRKRELGESGLISHIILATAPYQLCFLCLPVCSHSTFCWLQLCSQVARICSLRLLVTIMGAVCAEMCGYVTHGHGRPLHQTQDDSGCIVTDMYIHSSISQFRFCS